MTISVAASDQRRRDRAAFADVSTEKLVLSGPPQRSDSLLVGSPSPTVWAPLGGAPPGARQPVVSPAPLPRTSLVRRYFVNELPSDSTRPQRLPWASGVPNSKGRLAVTPGPTPASRWA